MVKVMPNSVYYSADDVITKDDIDKLGELVTSSLTDDRLSADAYEAAKGIYIRLAEASGATPVITSEDTASTLFAKIDTYKSAYTTVTGGSSLTI